MKKGFTLIELLVVVLIIGILAAIAVPQYETAVLKSRLGAVMSNVKRINDALELYYLNMGEYPADDLTSVDGEISGCTTGGGTMTCQHEVYDYWINANDTPVGGFPNDRGIAYVQYPKRGNPVNKRGTQECWASAGDKYANQACVSMGGEKLSTSNWRAYKGENWNTYSIP